MRVIDSDGSDEDEPVLSVVNELYGASLKVGNPDHDCRRDV